MNEFEVSYHAAMVGSIVLQIHRRELAGEEGLIKKVLATTIEEFKQSLKDARGHVANPAPCTEDWNVIVAGVLGALNVVFNQPSGKVS